MTIPSKTWGQFVQDMTNAWGASLGIVPVLPPGDFLLAVFESFATQLDFLQAQAFLILTLTRAATSTGADLDTFFADFDFPRLPATFATGPVIFSRNLPASSPTPIGAATLVGGVYQGGTLVQTVGGANVFRVVPDTTQTTYDPISNNYVLPAGATSLQATVVALVAGSSSNIAPGALQLGSQLAGIDTVLNQVPIANGVDQESDAAYRARFILYLSTLAKATYSAIIAAAQGVQQGLQISAVENQTPQGTPQLGCFTVFVDNGTGSPGAALLAAVYAAVDVTRAFSIQPFVAAPSIVNATVVLGVRLAAGTTLAAVQALVGAAVAEVADELPAGATLFVSAVEQAALTVPGVLAVQPGTLVNGVAADLVPSPISEVRIALSNVQVGQY
jgi:uncharacterized phage protein gp47/JayE